jgi:hypothetical protein
MNVIPEHKLDGITQRLPELSKQMKVILDVSIDLQISLDWYDVLDPEWGGPPSKKNLLAIVHVLRETYMGMASITGLDPCWQFEETKQKRRLMARSVADIEMPDFQDD